VATQPIELNCAAPGAYSLTVGQAAAPVLVPQFIAKKCTHDSIVNAMGYWPAHPEASIVVYDQETGDCTLMRDITSDRAPVIEANLVPSADVMSWQINGAGWSSHDLARHIRFHREMLVECDHKTLIASLEDFKAKIISEIEKFDQADGTKRSASIDRQIVVKNKPEKFSIHGALYVGTAPITMEIGVRYEQQNSTSVLLHLECEDLSAYDEHIRTKMGEHIQQVAEEKGYLFIVAGDNQLNIPIQALTK